MRGGGQRSGMRRMRGGHVHGGMQLDMQSFHDMQRARTMQREDGRVHVQGRLGRGEVRGAGGWMRGGVQRSGMRSMRGGHVHGGMQLDMQSFHDMQRARTMQREDGRVHVRGRLGRCEVQRM